MTRYFISGHIDLKQEEFDKYYKIPIMNAIIAGGTFVIGSAPGADYMAQQFLIDLLDDSVSSKVTIYHKGYEPEMPLINKNIKTIGNFKSHNEKDSAMTYASDIDIAWVRSAEESKKLYGDNYNPNKKSGTQKNLERRYCFNII